MKRIALICGLLVAFASLGKAVPIDMNTQTCQDWLDAGEDEQEQMAAWLRGYNAGRSTGAVFDVARIRADTGALKRYCQNHLTTGLVSAASVWAR